MKSILRVIEAPYRTIEFCNQSSVFSQQVSERDNFLTICKRRNDNRNHANTVTLDRKDFIRAIEHNSSDVLILNSPGIRELRALRKTRNALFLFERITLLSILPLIYFLLKSTLAQHQKYHGLFVFKANKMPYFYLGCKTLRPLGKRTRHYLSPLVKVDEFFQTMNDLNVSYCVLRWFEELPNTNLNEDIDVLVDDADLQKVHGLMDARPGITPFDIYSKTGQPGSDFRGVPYYSFSLAEKCLKDSTLYKNKFKIPAPETYFYLLAYHAVFHKGERSGLRSERYELSIDPHPEHDYLHHLKQIASEARLEVSDWTLEGLHGVLESRGYAPPADSQYKLSLDNQYLKARLAESHKRSDYPKQFEGLVCFVAREKVIEHGLLAGLKKYIQKEGFTILSVTHLEEPHKSNFTAKVRGGNWGQGPWPVSGGLPSVVIVALDLYPLAPTSHDRSQHPGISNRRIRNKALIRDFINQCLPDQSLWFNGVHSSDNEIQAVEYLTLAGLDKKQIYHDILDYRQAFVTTYPIVGVLSQYSKRAKVELISYHGRKAIKKTFKPMCERFLANEIKAYTIFKGVLPIPELLETGDNYIITSYIEGGVPLERRVSVTILKQCLNLLRQLYDAGYSLLDFKPGNFLIDRKRTLYLIDFEFLYQYDSKPDFLNCYDLVGVPDTFDPAVAPHHRIPRGTKQFDTLWYDATHVRYNELRELNRIRTRIKSIVRYYVSELLALRARLDSKRKKLSVGIYRRLP